MWLVILSDQLRIDGLVGYYLTNYLILRRLIQKQFLLFLLRVLSSTIEGFILNFWVDSYVLLTRSLLIFSYAFNLHVLSLLLAFILGQDQTLLFLRKKRNLILILKSFSHEKVSNI